MDNRNFELVLENRDVMQQGAEGITFFHKACQMLIDASGGATIYCRKKPVAHA